MNFTPVANLCRILTTILGISLVLAFGNPAHCQDSSLVAKSMIGNSRKKSPRPIQIIFDEKGRMIHFPAPVIRESDRLIFSVRINRASFAKDISIIYNKLDSLLAFFKFEPENQLILWTLFTDTTNTASFMNDLENYRSLRANKTIDSFYKDLKYYEDGEPHKLILTAESLHHMPLSLYVQNLLYYRYGARLYMGDSSLIGEYYLKPMFHPKKVSKHQEDCYWWISDTLSVANLIAGGCRDCGGQIRFSMAYHDPLKATIDDWYNRVLDSAGKKMTDLVTVLTKLQKEMVQFARCDQKNSMTNPTTFKTWLISGLAKSILSSPAIPPVANEYSKFVDSIKDPNLPDSVRQYLHLITQQMDAVRAQAYQIVNENITKVANNLLNTIDTTQSEDNVISQIRQAIYNYNTVAVGIWQSDRKYLIYQNRYDSLTNLLNRPNATDAENRLYRFISSHQLYEFNREPVNESVPNFAHGQTQGDTCYAVLDSLLMHIRTAQHALVDWLWYNKGLLVADPIPTHTDDWVQAKKDSLDKATTALNELNQQKAFLDSSRVHLKPELWHLPVYKNIQAETDKITDSAKKVTKLVNSLKKQLSDDSTVKATAMDARRAYLGLLPVSCNYCLLSAHGNDLSKQFAYWEDKKAILQVYTSEEEKRRTTEIPEDVHASIVVHNIPHGAKTSVNQTLSSFDDTEEFTKLVQSLLKGLDSTGLLGTALGTGLGTLTNFVTGLSNPRPSFDPGMEAAVKALGKGLATAQNVLPASVAAYLDNSVKKSPVSLDLDLTVSGPIKKSTDTTDGYQSAIYTVMDSTAPYQVNIAVQIDSIKGKGTLKVGRLRRIELAAGIAIVTHPANQNTVDTAGNGFKVGTTENSSQVILGVKIYPWKSYQRDGEIIPRYFLRRFSFLAAVSIPKAFDNFYLGVAYDIVPGLTIGVGDNIYKQTYYQIQNAQIVNSTTRYRGSGTFYSLTVNPVILAQFVKLFFN